MILATGVKQLNYTGEISNYRQRNESKLDG
jgi:hypothetical protein